MAGRNTKRTGGLVAILVAAGVPAAMIFFLNPLQIAFSNLQDMEVSGGTLAVGALIAALVAFLLGAGLLWLLEKAGFRRTVPLAIAAALMFWLHSAVLVWDYGVLDGTNIDWRAHRIAGVLELLLWIGLLTAAAMRPEIARRVGLKILPVLLLISTLGTGLTVLNAPEAPSFHSYSLATGNQHLFSTKRNVIFLVLDAFQADVFAELLAMHPELAEQFEGFTFYRNAVAGFSKTYPSPALMLTGQYYENHEPLQQFLKRVYLEDSVSTKLVAADWDVGLYPYVNRTLYFDPAVASNIERETTENPALSQVAELLDLGVFRATPHILKRRVINDHEWRFRKAVSDWTEAQAVEALSDDSLWRSPHRHHDVRFIEELERNGRVAADRPVFRYFHFLAPHAPFLLNENLEMERLEGGREGFRRHSNVALQLVDRMLEKFRELEIYDNAAIFIVSDHGGGEYGAGVAEQYAGRAMTANSSADINRMEQASGLPLMMLKLPDAGGPLRISDAPVSLSDIAATLDALTIGAGGYPGKPVHEVGEEEQRQRRYLFYKFDGWTDEYLPPMKEFVVDGFSWDAAAWHATGNVLRGEVSPTETETAAPGFVETDKTLSTGNKGEGQYVLGDGWWSGEKDFTWTRGRKSTLHFRFEKPLKGDVSVTLRLTPNLGKGHVDHQKVIVRHDENVLDELKVTSYGNHTVIVPVGAGGASEFDLEIEVPGAFSPASALASTDERVLGIGLFSVRVGTSARVWDGEEIHFGVSDRGPSLLRKGWSESERTLTWTDGHEAQMHIPLSEELQGEDVELRFSLRPFVAPPELERQRVVVLANGEPVGDWVAEDGGKYAVTVPANITAGGAIDLVLKLPDATVPFAVTQSDDIRTLGVALFKLSVNVAR